MKRFRRERPEIPHHRWGFEVGLGITLLGMNKIAKFEGVADKKYRCIVAGHVPVAFLGIKFKSETARVAFGVSRAFLSADGGKAQEGWSLLADGVKQFCGGAVGDFRVSADKVSVGGGTFGMDHTLGNTFAVEVRHLFEQQVIFKNNWSTGPHSKRILVIAHGTTSVRCHYFLFLFRHDSSSDMQRGSKAPLFS